MILFKFSLIIKHILKIKSLFAEELFIHLKFYPNIYFILLP